MKTKDSKKKTDKIEKEHEPSNAEISMKALEGKGAYEEDDDDEPVDNEKRRSEERNKRR